MLCGLATAPLGCRGREIRECEASIEAGQFEQAAMNCERAYQGTGDPRAGLLAAQALSRLGRAEAVEQWADRLEPDEVRAEVLALSGSTFFRAGHPAEALSAFRRELELRRRIGDPEETGRSAYSVAYFSRMLSDYSDAIESYALAYQQASKSPNRELAAQALEGLHNVLREIGDLERARLLLERAEETNPNPEALPRFAIGRGLLLLHSGRPRLAQATFEEVAAQPAPSRILQSAHLNLVEAYLETGDLPAAEHHIAAAWESLGDVTSSDSLLLALRGKTAAAGGRLDQALADFARALALAPGPNLAWEIHSERGKIYEQLGDLEQAELAYTTAIEVIEESRATVGPDDFRERLLAKRRQPHERLFRLQAQSSAIVAAIATAERIKARTFMDAFVRATSELPDEGTERRSTSEVARGGRTRLEGLRHLLPALDRAPVARPRPIEEILEALGAHHILLFLEVDGDEFWRIQLAPGRPPAARRLAVPATRLTALVEELISLPDDPARADALGAALLAEAVLPEPDSALVFITDGVLGELPFGLLRWNGRYLAERHRISYVPSLTALAAIDGRTWDPSDAAAVVLADPLGDLPAAAAEGQEIAARLGVSAYQGRRANREALTTLATPRLLHLATHTSMGPLGPSLVLADGSISASDLLDRSLDPAIVVLASCASAARRGEGLWGSMAGAFLAGGARVVVASLWSVEDDVAHDFVSRFYRAGGFENPFRALADAQRSLLAEGREARHWAPFVVLGSARALGSIEGNGGDE